MKRNVIKVFIIVLLTMIMITPAISLAYSVGSIIPVSGYFPGLFCINHGLLFPVAESGAIVSSQNLRVYEVGNISDLRNVNTGAPVDDIFIAFLLGDSKKHGTNAAGTVNGTGGGPWNGWQHYIWDILGQNTNYGTEGTPHPENFPGIKEKYDVYKEAYDKAIAEKNNPGDSSKKAVKIESDSEIMVPNSDGLTGPYKITIPYSDKIEELIECKITVNDTTVLFDNTTSTLVNKLVKADKSPFQIGVDTEFYVDIADLTYGANNKFNVEYKLHYYKPGQYYKLTPERFMVFPIECTYCGAKQYLTIEGYRQGNSLTYINGGTTIINNGMPNSSALAKAGIPTGSIQGKANFNLGSDQWPLTAYEEGDPDWFDDNDELDGGFFKRQGANIYHVHIRENPTTGALQQVGYPTSILYSENILFREISYKSGVSDVKGHLNEPWMGLQDFILLEADEDIIPLTAELEVLVGQPNIKILLNKINSLTKANVSGVEFEVSATDANLSSDGGTTWANPITITTTDSDMEIEIKPDNEGVGGLINEITVTFKETGLADESEYLMYRDETGDPGCIQITYEWDATSMEWKHKETKYPKYENGVEEKAEISDVEKNSWKLTAENRPKIEELSGYVWIDKPSGEKDINPPDGINNENEYKEGVKVFLYKSDGSQVEYDGYGERFGGGGEGYLVTDGNGEYKFENIPKLPDGESYYIVFEYDGINYICTKLGGDSKADETDRAGFNSKFVTISPGQSNGGIALNYNYSGNASTLITEDGDGVVYDDFAIKADTQTAGNTYTETATDINLGIVKKVLDLALKTDLYEVTATINGINPPKVKKYNAIFDNVDETVIDAMQNKTADGVEYNINLYRSDYNYRIGQYINSPSIAHQPSLAAEEITALQNSRAELVVTLEYKVLLANQSTTNASIDKFEYYYDSHLKFKNITGGVATDEGNKLTITPSDPNLGHGECKEVSLVFEAVNLSDEQVVKNYAEIIQYSTAEGGYVDCDSAPGNANIGSGAMQYEDDTDEAKGAKITLSLTDREVSGYVFEDKKEIVGDAPEYITGNGIYDNGETPVDDVIVQLIEIKNLDIAGNKHRLEYIWQETTSGSNIVRKISDDGTKIDTIQYQNIAPETGKYVFRGFIPGDYIVRFIYGDGTYKDTAINTANLLKYNGQDYKSTLDEKWNSNYLTTEGYSNADCSMARDNEARRLEVMAYAVGVTDGEDLRIDNVAKLENTWMAAETSKIVVEDCLIDGVSTFYRKSNFGLVEKPVTKLSLKKHIVSAELKDATGDTIIQASAPNSGYLDDSTIIENFNVSVQKAPIEATATTRTNRGYWQVEINNVDGAELILAYKYTVTNTGEPDYLNKTLIEAFTSKGKYEDSMKAYKEEIEKCAEKVKKAMKIADKDDGGYDIENTYLGYAYYSGKKAANDEAVATYINLEDYLGDLKLDGAGDFEAIGKENKKIINKVGNEATETVEVIKTKNGKAITSNRTVSFDAIVNCPIADKRTFPSYIAQVITPITTLSGTKITDSTANNLEYVQSYYSVARLDDLGLGKGTESDEFWAETFRIVPTTGEDKESGLILTISITAGLAIIAIGIILIKKIIKE